LAFISSLFGDLGSNVWSVAGALAIVIVLIVFLVWLLKFALNASRSVARGRNRRIGVTESVMVDTKRQLVLIRRDDVEHLVLTGGPQDLIVEADIPLISPEPLAVPPRRTAPVSGDNRAEPGRASRAEPGEPPIAASARPSFAAVSSAPPIVNGGEVAGPRAGPSGRVAGLTARPEEPSDTRVSPIQKLRQLSQRSGAKGVASLRYPGLLRPITRHRGLDPAPANKTDQLAPDSDMSLPGASEPRDEGSVDGQDGNAGDTTEDATETKSQR